MMTIGRLRALALAGILVLPLAPALVLSGPAHAAAETRVVELTQTACQFIESENGVERGYTTTRKADCEAINARTGAGRLAEAETLTLAPGRTIFRVTNRDVPYDLGFWLREEDYNSKNPLHRLFVCGSVHLEDMDNVERGLWRELFGTVSRSTESDSRGCYT